MNPAIGLDVGGTKILGVLLDQSAPQKVLAEHRVSTPPGGDAIVVAMEEVYRSLAATYVQKGVGDPGTAPSLGIGIAGLVDQDGVLHVGPNLPSLRDKPVRAEMEARLGAPVTVNNDVTCAAWAEVQAGAATGARDAVCVTLGTGIGAGIVMDGRVMRGRHGFAGEAGHMIVDPTGPVCPCGRRGCWERMASGSGLMRLARDAAEAGRLERSLDLAGGDVSAVRGEHVSQAAAEGDEQALELMRTFAWWVALGIANLVTLLDPAVVVVGGGLVEIGEPLFAPLRDHYADLVMAGGARTSTRITPAELGERAGAVGAALLAPVA